MDVFVAPPTPANIIKVNPPSGGNSITVYSGQKGDKGDKGDAGIQGLPGPNYCIPDYDTCTVTSVDSNDNPLVLVLKKNGSVVGSLHNTYNINNNPTIVVFKNSSNVSVATWNISYDGNNKFHEAVRT
jgi:hypothetical protein